MSLQASSIPLTGASAQSLALMYHELAVMVQAGATLDTALEQAAGAGIELGSWFECPLHPFETPLESYDYEIGMCPEAEKAAREVVNLPLHERAHEKTVNRSVDFISRFAPATDT